MVVARMLWDRKNPYVYTYALEGDRMCRDWFGCGPAVLLDTWKSLVAFELVPNDGTLEHMLWTFVFMKQYPKSQALYKLCGGHDLKTIRYRVRDFIDQLAMLESTMVSAALLPVLKNVDAPASY
jgi:hypothetical protein